MSLTGTVIALASGFAARLAKPEDHEIAELKAKVAALEAERNHLWERLELRIGQLQAAERLLATRRIEDRLSAPEPAPALREVVDCTGGGRYAHLMGLQQQMAVQQYYAAQQQQAVAQTPLVQQAQVHQALMMQQMQNAFAFGNIANPFNLGD